MSSENIRSVPKFMGFYTLTEHSKGYFIITVPKEFVEKKGWKKGDKFACDTIDDIGQIIYTRKNPKR